MMARITSVGNGDDHADCRDKGNGDDHADCNGNGDGDDLTVCNGNGDGIAVAIGADLDLNQIGGDDDGIAFSHSGFH